MLMDPQGQSYRMESFKSVKASGPRVSTRSPRNHYGSGKDPLSIEKRDQADLTKLGKRPVLKVDGPFGVSLQSCLTTYPA